MNIQEAKQEIIHTLQAYLRKDDAGNICFRRYTSVPFC